MKPYLLKVLTKTMLSLFCIVLLHTNSFSQYTTFGNEGFKVEAGLNFGPNFFLGDLGGNYGKGTTFLKDLNLEATKILKGAFITLYPADWIGFRFAGQISQLYGDDALVTTQGEHETYRRERNLDFKSNIWELYTAVELYPTMMFNRYDDYNPRLKPYGFVGIGLFHFDPMGSLKASNGSVSWHKLHPLKTEGQGMQEYPEKNPYDLTQINIPMGFGLKYQISDKVTIGTEFLYRHTFTDYIDDLSTTYIDPKYFSSYLSPADAAIARKIHDKSNSLTTPTNRTIPGEQRGNVNNNDAYFSTVLKIGIQLGSGGNSAESRNYMRQMKCPSFY